MTVQLLFDLEIGDRFYFVGDPKKEVREIHSKKYHYRSGRVLFVIYPDLKEGHRNREVVFLRNVNDKP